MRGFLDERRPRRAEADKNSLVLPLTDDSFDEATKYLFVVEFFAPWCPHHEKLPHMEEAAKQLSGHATDTAGEGGCRVAQAEKRFQIDSFPQFRAFRKGKLVEGSKSTASLRPAP